MRLLVDANLSPVVASDCVQPDTMAPEQHAALLHANLDALAEDLDAGAVASFARGTIRVRRLPFSSA